MERHQAGTATVIPVILRDCDWHSATFGKLNAVPRDGKPVTLWPNIDQAFAEVAKQIRRVVEGRPPAAAKATNRQPSGSSGVLAASGPKLPRSSNLPLSKEFSEQDRDEFLRTGFDYFARFFEGSLQALQERNSDVKVTIRGDTPHTMIFARLARPGDGHQPVGRLSTNIHPTPANCGGGQ